MKSAVLRKQNLKHATKFQRSESEAWIIEIAILGSYFLSLGLLGIDVTGIPKYQWKVNQS